MRLSKTEGRAVVEVALGKKKVHEIALALKKDPSQIYRVIKSLEKKGFVVSNKGVILPSEKTHVSLFLQEVSRHPNIINNLSGCGIVLFTAILNPKSLPEIIKGTGIKRSTIFLKFKEASKISFLRTTEKNYVFNEKLWSGVKEFLMELKKHEETVDKRVPPGSSIHFKNKDEIVFSTKIECDAALTGFSAFESFGIKLMTVDNTYYLPKKSLTKKQVFLHALYRAEKEENTRDIILLALFYAKYKKELSGIRHEIRRNMDKVLQGGRVREYPSLAEIKERAEVYDIKV